MSRKQNILILFPDQLRADALSCNGCQAISTPHLDRLASEGVNYTGAISPTPLCIPARASVLTGRNSLETGVLNNESWLRPDHSLLGMPSWPELLNKKGYMTAAIGKMHFYPWDLSEGFQKRVIAEDKRHIHVQDDYQSYLQKHGLRKFHGNEHENYLENKGAVVSRIPMEHQVDTWVAEETIKFLSGLKEDKPFAVMTGFPGPHCPYDPPVEYLDLVDVSKISKPLKNSYPWMSENLFASCRLPWNGVEYSDAEEKDYLKIRHHYLAMVKQIDDGVGRILDYLDEKKLSDSTTVIFTADHGDFLGDHNMIGKHFFLNQAISVPMIIRGKGFEPGRINDSLLSLSDLFSTVLNIAGIEFEDSDDSSVLCAEKREDRMVFGSTDIGLFAAWKSWRMSRYFNGESYLFNIGKDPEESCNLIDSPDYSDIQKLMGRRLDSWLIKSNLKGHSDKLVFTGAGDPGDSYNRRDWSRPYPYYADSATS